MFDLIEQDLATAPAIPAVKADPQPLDVVVYVMPERFRVKVKESSSLPIVIGAIFLFLLVVSGSVAYFVYIQQNKPLTTIPQQPKKNSEPTPAVVVPNATSTTPASTLEPTQEIPPQETPAVPENTSNKNKETQTDTSSQTTQGITSYVDALDTDGDELTDEEEKVFHTDAKKPNTNDNNYADGAELKNLYDPSRAGIRLEDSTLVNRYTNATYRYSLLYPSAWLASAVAKSDTEVLISTTAAKEYFSVKVMENPDNLPAADFYTKVVLPGTDTSTLQSLSSDTWNGILSADGLTAYFTKKITDVKDAKPMALIMQYVPNTSLELHFRTTFQMMMKSLTFTDLTFVKK